MQFVQVGEFLAAIKTTGPKHNLLQLRLGYAPQEVPVCERLPSVSRCRHAPLDESELIASVLLGVSEANFRFGSHHSVTHIRYVEDDTKPESVYMELASRLIERLETGGVFTKAKNA
jgi:hypothetical protein